MENEITFEEIENNNLMVFLYNLIMVNERKIEDQKTLIDDLITRMEVLENV